MTKEEFLQGVRFAVSPAGHRAYQYDSENIILFFGERESYVLEIKDDGVVCTNLILGVSVRIEKKFSELYTTLPNEP